MNVAARFGAIGARVDRLSQYIGDRANPLLVRYVRQELRNKTFIAVFILLLLTASLISLFGASIAGYGGSSRAGVDLFGKLAIAWTFCL